MNVSRAGRRTLVTGANSSIGQPIGPALGGSSHAAGQSQD